VWVSSPYITVTSSGWASGHPRFEGLPRLGEKSSTSKDAAARNDLPSRTVRDRRSYRRTLHCPSQRAPSQRAPSLDQAKLTEPAGRTTSWGKMGLATRSEGDEARMSEGPGRRPMVIVGGSKAGGTAAATLRDEGFNGPVVLVSREPGIPFGRPPLSKTYLRSEEDLNDWYVRPPDWYEAHDVDLRPDSVVALDPAAHALALGPGGNWDTRSC
jgi:hypothetical protein